MTRVLPSRLSPKLGAAAILVASLCVAVASADTLNAADPFQAGQISARPVALPPQAQSAIEARVLGHLHDLGLRPGVRRSIQRLEDRFESTTYDEVTEIDPTGQPVTVLQYELSGRLKSAVALGWQPGRGPAVADPPTAARRGRAFARSAGEFQGEPQVSSLPENLGWNVSWPRMVDGIPVPGDGLRLTLWPDGSLHSLVRSERALAAKPGNVIDEASARSIVDGLLATWYGAAADQLVLESAPLAWVAPNDAFTPARADAPGSTLRLARVVAVRATGSLADQVERLEVYVDAGDGSLLGGDVLE